ncbi:hypothetical protein BGZ96_005798 [Linnemannia gamsii]|uniref:Uncharacterized protein n=1 Tax=Linnemannia gamsii TaxID=64522 RepID=A0ABQ7K4J5_9FUNG|nr:hypothetical protein BGZ96_005798 [Linnemannia gamsii]
MEDDNLFESWPRKSARIRDRQAARAEQEAARVAEASEAIKVKEEEKEQHKLWSQQRDAHAVKIQKSNRIKAVQAARKMSATPSTSSTLSSVLSSVAESSSPPQLLSDPKDEDCIAEDADATAVGSPASATSSLNPSSPPSSGTDSSDDDDLNLASDSENGEDAEDDDEDGERSIAKTSSRRLPSVPASSSSNLGARTQPRGAVSGKTLPGTRDALIANSKTARRSAQRRNAKNRPTRPPPYSRSHQHNSDGEGDEEDDDEEAYEDEEDEGSPSSSVFDCGELLDDLPSEGTSSEHSDDEHTQMLTPLTGKELARKLLGKCLETFMGGADHLLTPFSMVIYWMPTPIDDCHPENMLELWTLPVKATDQEWATAEVITNLRTDQVAHWLQIAIGDLLGFLVQATMPSCLEWLNTDVDPQPGDPVYEVLHRFRSLDDEQQRLLVWAIKKETRFRREADARKNIDTLPYRPIVFDDFQTRAEFDYLLKTWSMHRSRTSPVVEFRASERLFPGSGFVDHRARDRWFVKVNVSENSLEELTVEGVRDVIKADCDFLHQLESSRADYQEFKMANDEVVIAAYDPRLQIAHLTNIQGSTQVSGARASPLLPRGLPPPPARLGVPPLVIGGYPSPRGPLLTVRPLEMPQPHIQHRQHHAAGGYPFPQVPILPAHVMAPQLPSPILKAGVINADPILQDSASTTPRVPPLPLPLPLRIQPQPIGDNSNPQLQFNTSDIPIGPTLPPVPRSQHPPPPPPVLPQQPAFTFTPGGSLPNRRSLKQMGVDNKSTDEWMNAARKAVLEDENWWRHELLQIMQWHQQNTPASRLQVDLPLMNLNYTYLQQGVRLEYQRQLAVPYREQAVADKLRKEQQALVQAQRQQEDDAARQLMLLQLQNLADIQQQQKQQEMTLTLERALTIVQEQRVLKEVQEQQVLIEVQEQQQQQAIALELEQMVLQHNVEMNLQQQQHQHQQIVAEQLQQQHVAEKLLVQQMAEQQQRKLMEQQQQRSELQQQQMLESLQQRTEQLIQQQHQQHQQLIEQQVLEQQQPQQLSEEQEKLQQLSDPQQELELAEQTKEQCAGNSSSRSKMRNSLGNPSWKNSSNSNKSNIQAPHPP